MRAPVVALPLVLAVCGDDGGAGGSGTGSTSSTTEAPGGSTSVPGSSSATSAGSSSTTTTGGVVDDTTGTTGEPGTDNPKSLMLAVDGLRPDSLAMANTPAIDSLIDGTWQDGYQGAYAAQAQCLTDAPSVSGPNHWSIMTGATGRQHGVSGNGDVDTGDARNFPHYLSLLEAADPELATVYLFTWLPDIQIPCDADYILNATDAFNSAQVVNILEGTLDDPNGHVRTQWALDTEPDAIFLFLDDIDGAGHGFGFGDAPEYLAAIEVVDGQIGAILDAIAARRTFADESWQIVLTSDHGGLGTNHGGDSPEELTIPFLVAGRDVVQGVLPPAGDPQGTRIFDTVPTVLEHMGVGIPEALTGNSRAGG